MILSKNPALALISLGILTSCTSFAQLTVHEPIATYSGGTWPSREVFGRCGTVGCNTYHFESGYTSEPINKDITIKHWAYLTLHYQEFGLYEFDETLPRNCYSIAWPLEWQGNKPPLASGGSTLTGRVCSQHQQIFVGNADSGGRAKAILDVTMTEEVAPIHIINSYIAEPLYIDPHIFPSPGNYYKDVLPSDYPAVCSSWTRPDPINQPTKWVATMTMPAPSLVHDVSSHLEYDTSLLTGDYLHVSATSYYMHRLFEIRNSSGAIIYSKPHY